MHSEETAFALDSLNSEYNATGSEFLTWHSSQRTYSSLEVLNTNYYNFAIPDKDSILFRSYIPNEDNFVIKNDIIFII